MTKLSSFRDLIVWQKAMKLVTRIYQATRSFPKEELFGLTNQLRRAAVSIPSNIAEGQGRLTTGEFKNHLGIARGSLNEVQTQILLAFELEYLPEASANALIEMSDEVGKMLNGLLNSLK